MDVQAGDPFVTVTSAKLEALPMVSGVSSYLSAYQPVPLAPYQFHKQQVLKPGLYHINLTYSVDGQTGEWDIPYLVDYSIQPSWALYNVPVEAPSAAVYQHATQLAAYTITGALFMGYVFWTAKKFREVGRQC